MEPKSGGAAEDLTAVIQEVYGGERETLDGAIASLEQALTGMGSAPPGKPRGWKSMGAAERNQVSERMKRYGARRNSMDAKETGT